MKLFIKEDLIRIRNFFEVKNENDEVFVKVQSKYFTIGKKLTVFSPEDKELFFIKQKLFKILPKYTISQNGKIVATIKKRLFSVFAKMSVKSDYGEYTMEGNWLAHNFKILKDGNIVATINKKLVALRDAYSVDISEEENAEFIVALIITIDQIMHGRNKKINLGILNSH